jgi:TonB family protein
MILKSYFTQKICEASYWMKSLFVAVALLASWWSLDAEGAESHWTGEGPENSSHPSAVRVEQAETQVVRDKKGKIICKVVYAPMPIYPKIAWVQNEGKSLFQVSLRPNGTVSAVAIERSTGYRELDAAAIEALKQWRFQVKTGVTRVHIPVNFTKR